MSQGPTPTQGTFVGRQLLYCTSYRSTSGKTEKSAINIWVYPLKVGDVLPELPLFISSDVAVPIDLEGTYMEVCKIFRIR